MAILNIELRDEIADILARDAAVLQMGRAPYIRMLLAAIALGRDLPVARRTSQDDPVVGQAVGSGGVKQSTMK